MLASRGSSSNTELLVVADSVLDLGISVRVVTLVTDTRAHTHKAH